MGLVGPGFVGAHHIDAVRRLGFVDVVAVSASTEASARRKADALGVPKAYGSYEALVADPDIHVVHNTTPNYLHVPVVLAALERGKHVISDKPLAMTAADAKTLYEAAKKAGVVHAVTFNYRGNPLVQQAREMIAGGELGRVHFVHGEYSRTGSCRTRTSRGASSPKRAVAHRPSVISGRTGAIWCSTSSARKSSKSWPTSRRSSAPGSSRRHPPRHSPPRRMPRASRSASAARIWPASGPLRRWRRRARCRSGRSAPATRTISGSRSAGARRRCAGCRNGRTSSGSGGATRANGTLLKDPSLLGPPARAYAHLPGGHQEAWADAFCNVMRDVYGFIAARKPPTDPRPPAFATFEDGYQSARIVDAILASHTRGGVWTKVEPA